MPSLIQHRLRSRLLKRPPQPKHPFAILHLPQTRLACVQQHLWLQISTGFPQF